MLHFGRAARKFCILMLSLYLIVVCSMCVHNRQVSRRHFKTSSVTEQYNYFGRAYIVYGFFFYPLEASSAPVGKRMWEMGRVWGNGNTGFNFRFRNLFIVKKKQCAFRRHNNSINITYTINMLYVSALLNHHQA